MKLNEKEYPEIGKNDIFVRCHNCGHLIQSFYDCYYKVSFATSLEDYMLTSVLCNNCVKVKSKKERKKVTSTPNIALYSEAKDAIRRINQ